MRIRAAILCLLLAEVAGADGGTVRIDEEAVAFRVAVMSAPEPLRVGAADLSVLVQRLGDASPVLDAEVDLRLDGPAPGAPIEVRASREQATNQLLQAAAVTLPAAGTWRLRVRVRQGGDAVEVAGELPVAPAPPRLQGVWPYLALPPAVAACFALREWLARRGQPGS